MNKTRPTNTVRNVVIGTAAALAFGAIGPWAIHKNGVMDLSQKPPVSWFLAAKEKSEAQLYGSTSNETVDRNAKRLSELRSYNGYRSFLGTFKVMAWDFKHDNEMWADGLVRAYENLVEYAQLTNVKIHFSAENLRSVEQAKEIVQTRTYERLKFGVVYEAEIFARNPKSADAARNVVFAHDFLLEWADMHGKAPEITGSQTELVDQARKVAFGDNNDLYLRPYGAKEAIYMDGVHYFGRRFEMLKQFKETGKLDPVSVESRDPMIGNGQTPIWVQKNIAPEALAASLAHTYDYLIQYARKIGVDYTATPEQLEMVEYARKLSGVKEHNNGSGCASWDHAEASIERAKESVKSGDYRYADIAEPDLIGYWFVEDMPVGPQKK